ncbi:MAG: glycine cleavage system aminomethyltransferase GcvT [Chloroflexota bacterium]|nr:glycine cleavage system aminomethyltransferase GcvT [Chloroflexota bacterium]
MEKKTPLYDEHVKARARLVPFAGFDMPVQYSGIIDEHRAVRTGMGIFDLSHMGEFRVTGVDALNAIDSLVTNDIRGLAEHQVRYTPMCYRDGGIVDDLLVYRFPDHLMLVVNASGIEKDLAWIRSNSGGDLQVEDISDQTALIAVQGPKAEALLQQFTDAHLADVGYYHFTIGAFAGKNAVISRTGYTGEDGFELYVQDVDAPAVWQTIAERGTPEGLKLIGLGARDTLRLEAGYMLYGNDIDQTTNPLEAGLGWTVKFGEHDFVAREVLERVKVDGVKRRMVAIDMRDRGIPRQHSPICAEGQAVGEVTSGTFSPSFERGIGLGYVETARAKIGADIQVAIRGQEHPAQIVRKPMYRREGA